MTRTRSQPRARSRRLCAGPALASAAALVLALGLAGCAGFLPNLAADRTELPRNNVQCNETVLQRASTDKLSYLEFELDRLREDLHEAEFSMVALESGMRGRQSRADAVSAVAEARIAVERVSQTVPWRAESVKEALHKLDEAERELTADHRSTAIFFASRARRIANTLDAERERVATTEGTRFIRARRVNLRTGPSANHSILNVLALDTPVFHERAEGQWLLVRTLTGHVGWVYGELVR